MTSPVPDAASLLRILVADPHPIVCAGLTAVFSREADMEVVGEAQSAEAIVTLCDTLSPHVVVMEIDLPATVGMEVIETLTQRFPATCILVVSRLDGEETIYRALEAGARGYYLKSSDGEALAAGLRVVCNGHRAIATEAGSALTQRLQRGALSAREIELLALLAKGCSNGEIGAKLFISEGTVKAHLNTIYQKLQVAGRMQAVIVALQRGLVSLR